MLPSSPFSHLLLCLQHLSFCPPGYCLGLSIISYHDWQNNLLNWSPHFQTFLSCLSSCWLQRALQPDLMLYSPAENPWLSIALCPLLPFQAHLPCTLCPCVITVVAAPHPRLPCTHLPPGLSFDSSGKLPLLSPSLSICCGCSPICL